MKCFYHPDRDAAGMCTECGKAACHECLKEVSGRVLCKGCIARHLKEVETQKQAVETERKITIDQANRRLRISKIVFVVFFLFGMVIAVGMAIQSLTSRDPQAPGFLTTIIGGSLGAVITGYYAWSLFWGAPGVWRFVRGLFQKIGCFVVLNPITWLIVAMVFLFILTTCGAFYSIFGGGWVEYRRHLRIAAGRV